MAEARMRRHRHAKIVATVGPASSAPDRLRDLFLAGVDTFRLNFSHGVQDDHGKVHAAIRALEREVGRPIGILALEALRVEAHRPRFGLETDHRTIPHELGWLETAVHLNKGCYRGQETVARVHNLGRPPRRLVFLHLDGSGHVLPEPGAAVVLGDREVGRLTTVARHFEDGPVALAVVKRSTPVDVDLLAGGVSGAQTVVVTA